MGEPRRDEAAPGRHGWGPSFGWLALAGALVAGALAAWWLSTPPATSAPPPGPVAAAASSASAAPAVVAAAAPPTPTSGAAPLPASAAPRIPRVREAGADQTPDISDYINDGEKPDMGQVIERLHAAGVHTGLGAFNPPGTKPPLVGLAVPEDFPLPPGYVRHHQATDDGQRIEPILMFAPDYQPVDAAGRPVAVPVDRVVPPELAPPGLPIRRITIPAPLEPR
ncbi:MAG: hypothetical protein ACTHL8_11760 [Burkholderiaceae bacterium]